MTTQYNNRFLDDTTLFAEELLQIIKLLQIDLHDNIYQKYIITDENRNEWIIIKDCNSHMLEISVLHKKIVNNKHIYKSAWVYNKNFNCHNFNFIKIDNLYVLVNKTVSVLHP